MSNNTRASAANAERNILANEGNGTMSGVVGMRIFDASHNEVGFHEIYSGVDGGDVTFNKTLNTAKVILSRMLSGDTSYKLAKIGFGNAGHDFLNKKVKIPALETSTELRAITLIRDSLQLASDKQYIYTDTNSNDHRLSYIEKDILPENVTFGENGDQFIVRVPISYDDFNMRVGGSELNTVMFEDAASKFDIIENDGTLIKHRNTDSTDAIIDGGTHSEVARIDDAGTIRFRFKNGIASGSIDTVNHGERPQEVSEIMLCTDIIGDGSASAPYKKLASSITTSGLLELPEGFSFVYEWSLSWNFA